jgi:hypothetical protein
MRGCALAFVKEGHLECKERESERKEEGEKRLISLAFGFVGFVCLRCLFFFPPFAVFSSPLNLFLLLVRRPQLLRSLSACRFFVCVCVCGWVGGGGGLRSGEFEEEKKELFVSL